MSCVYRARFHWCDRGRVARECAALTTTFYASDRRRKLSDHLVDYRVGLVCGGDQLDFRPQVVLFVDSSTLTLSSGLKHRGYRSGPPCGRKADSASSDSKQKCSNKGIVHVTYSCLSNELIRLQETKAVTGSQNIAPGFKGQLDD